MPARGKARPGRRPEAALEKHPRGRLAPVAGVGAAQVPHPRRIACRLQVHAKIDDVGENLHLALRLHRAAHHAKGHHRLVMGEPRAGHEAGDDGVERPLARGDRIGRLGRERELRPPVLQHETPATPTAFDRRTARHHHARAHAAIVGLDERDHHAGLVCGGEIGRVAVRPRVAGRRVVGKRPAHGNARCLAGNVGVGQQRLDWHRHLPRVGEEAGPVGEGELFRLDQEVEPIGLGHAGHREPLDNARHLQGRQPLRRRRDLPQPELAIGRGNGGHPFGRERGEVGGAHRPAGPGEMRLDVGSEGAAIEALPAVARQHGIGLGKIGVGEERAFARRIAVRGIEREGKPGALDPVAPLREAADVGCPAAGNDRRQREAVAGEADRRRQHIGNRQPAEPGVERAPASDRPRHGHGIHPQRVDRAGGPVPAPQCRDIEPARREARGVEPDQPPRLRVPDEREQVAADAAAGRLDKAEHGVGRDRGIDRRPPRLQDRDCGRSRQRLGGCCHAPGADRCRTGLEWRVARPVPGARGACGKRRRSKPREQRAPPHRLRTRTRSLRRRSAAAGQPRR